MTDQINNLRERILNNRSKGTKLTQILELIRELGCFGDIVGRDFEVLDSDGDKVYTIRQKPISIKQMNVFLKELHILKGIDNEREAAKWGAKR